MAAATAQPRSSFHLVVERSEGAMSCSDESTLRSAVATRLGYDPFGDSTSTITVTVSGKPGNLRGRVVLRTQAKVRGVREIQSTSTGCAELEDAIAVAVSIAIDPVQIRIPSASAAASAPASVPPIASPGVSAPPAPVPSASVAPPVPAPTLSAPIAPPPPPAHPQLRLWLTGGPSFGVAPNITATFMAGAGLRWPSWSGGLEARVDMPASSTAPQGRVVGSFVGATGSACAHRSAFGGCAIVSLGAFRASGEQVLNPRSDMSLYAASGGRLLWEPAVTSDIHLRFAGDVLVTMRPSSLQIGGEDQWTTPSVSAILSLGLAASVW